MNQLSGSSGGQYLFAFLAFRTKFALGVWTALGDDGGVARVREALERLRTVEDLTLD